MSFAKHLPENDLRRPLAVPAGLLLVVFAPVFAHHPMGGMTPQTFSQGLLSGLGHPIIGLDHFAFLVAAMLLASVLKGAARYLAGFAAIEYALIIGGVLGMDKLASKSEKARLAAARAGSAAALLTGGVFVALGFV